VIQAASEIKQTGATGAYTREFEKLEKQLDEVKQLLENTTVSPQDLERLENLVEKFRYELNLDSCKTKTISESIINLWVWRLRVALRISVSEQHFSLKMGLVRFPKQCFIYCLLFITFMNLKHQTVDRVKDTVLNMMHYCHNVIEVY